MSEPPAVLVEQKVFPGRYEQCEPIVRAALEHTFGALDELSPGMWQGRSPAPGGGHHLVTIRALPVEGGTSVEVRVETKVDGGKQGAMLLFLIVASCLIVPLLFVIPHLQRQQAEQSNQRLIAMHRAWTELAEALGAPKRATYRDQPHTAYAPLRIEAEQPEQPEQAVLTDAAEAERVA